MSKITNSLGIKMEMLMLQKSLLMGMELMRSSSQLKNKLLIKLKM